LEPSLRWDDDIKMNLKDMVCHNADFVKWPTNTNLVTKSRLQDCLSLFSDVYSGSQ